MIILKRPPGDSFTFRLFVDLVSKVKQPKSPIYLWSAVLDPTYALKSNLAVPEYVEQPVDDSIWYFETELYYRSRIAEGIKTDLVLLGIKDHLTSGDFNYWSDKLPSISVYLDDMFDFYNDKKFILFTSVENLSSYINRPNVKIIPWGGDITNHKKEYQTLEPILDKNFDSDKTFLSLNRNKRSHRAMLVSLLYGMKMNNDGLISCMFKDSIEDLFDYTKWKVSNEKIYSEGFKLLKSSNLNLNDSKEIYYNNNNDNVSNFKNKLSDYYRNTFVEIISETSFTESYFNLTEKTLHSIYGCSFPILLCSKGSVQFLRDMGLDMFDDIVNHSYDEINDPALRLEHAILSNKELLTNNKRTKKLWLDNQQRFKNNVDFCRERMYNFYYSRSIRMFDEIINDTDLQK